MFVFCCSVSKSSSQGNVHYIRFCRRCDLDPSNIGPSGVEETSKTLHAPHGDDVLMVAKKWMGDSESFFATVMVSADDATAIRLGFEQPQGIAERRSIPQTVVKNIGRFAPRCASQNIISLDASTYLLAWSGGSLPSISRPTQYSFLNYRQPTCDMPGIAPMAWRAHGRQRHVNLASHMTADRDVLLDSDDEDDDNGNRDDDFDCSHLASGTF